MLKSIFRKTLFEKRWMTFWWALVTFLLILGVTVLFPLFKGIGGDLAATPESLKALVGDASSFSTITGWLSFQVFDQMVFIGIILGIIVGGALLAGEEGEGTLQSLLALPVRRTAVYVQKFVALAVVLGVINLCLFFATWLGVVLIGETVPLQALAESTAMALLLSLLFAALTFALGAVTGKRGLAGVSVGLFAFVSFMITSLAAGISALKYVDYFSPFHYYNKPSPFVAGFQAADAIVLSVAALVILAIGFVVFMRRDVYQR